MPPGSAPAATGVACWSCWTTQLLAELHNEEDRLDLLETGDDHTSVRAVLSWSYRRLAPEAARLYRLCGFRCPHPGHHLDVHGAAALLGATDLRTARRLLGELVRSGLMEVAPDGRHRMHDLLRVRSSCIPTAATGR
ncbi:hypothetical protein [Pseudonocardia sp. MH-G8]|uniref:hypothetical protein n=1 Tax=Pseudonocardia sp. MH-G8 TaxID=1854588 RepID=UPI000BA150CD|nr:hypothetical protein [Pseudonocardia sp. MH-G8]OZM75523.1 hypothetical protein CFP66_45865 [Pseudonocardia sp. MH-G8]